MHQLLAAAAVPPVGSGGPPADASFPLHHRHPSGKRSDRSACLLPNLLLRGPCPAAASADAATGAGSCAPWPATGGIGYASWSKYVVHACMQCNIWLMQAEHATCKCRHMQTNAGNYMAHCIHATIVSIIALVHVSIRHGWCIAVECIRCLHGWGVVHACARHISLL